MNICFSQSELKLPSFRVVTYTVPSRETKPYSIHSNESLHLIPSANPAQPSVLLLHWGINLRDIHIVAGSKSSAMIIK